MPLVRDICDRHGILLIADEVITAFGRTGAWTGSRLWDVRPDMMCTAKAITNGYFPFGATMIGEGMVDAFESNKDGAGEINHGYTYSGHPVGAAAALAMLEQLKTTDVAANSGARGEELGEGLARLKQKHRFIGDARGVGLMHALELVSDSATKTALDKKSMAFVGEAIYENGVMVRISGNNIILSPPLVITNEHVERIVDAIDAGLHALTKQAGAA
jgi:adenosylmethionine-8-amino-7-oxononanoate aminotransferase